MRRNAFTLVELLICVAIVLILAAILFPILGRRREPRRNTCPSNLKQISLGLAQYVQDYDDFMPLISAGNQGWAESAQPYLKSWQIFQCSFAENRADGKKPFSTDYFINARVAGLKRSLIPSGAQTLFLGEGWDNGGANSHFSELPFDWISAEKSPLKRHLDGANYAFVDGHVKWLRPDKVTTKPIKEGSATFAIN